MSEITTQRWRQPELHIATEGEDAILFDIFLKFMAARATCDEVAQCGTQRVLSLRNGGFLDRFGRFHEVEDPCERLEGGNRIFSCRDSRSTETEFSFSAAEQKMRGAFMQGCAGTKQQFAGYYPGAGENMDMGTYSYLTGPNQNPIAEINSNQWYWGPYGNEVDWGLQQGLAYGADSEQRVVIEGQHVDSITALLREPADAAPAIMEPSIDSQFASNQHQGMEMVFSRRNSTSDVCLTSFVILTPSYVVRHVRVGRSCV